MKILITFFVICISQLLTGQSSVYEHIDISDGLPSNFVYRTYEDSKGYIWFATEGGAVRYDGKNMKIFDSSSGLKNEDVHKIQEDGAGRIWFLSISPDLVYYKEDSLYVIPNITNSRHDIIFMDEYCTTIDFRENRIIFCNDMPDIEIYKSNSLKNIVEKRMTPTISQYYQYDSIGEYICIIDNSGLNEIDLDFSIYSPGFDSNPASRTSSSKASISLTQNKDNIEVYISTKNGIRKHRLSSRPNSQTLIFVYNFNNNLFQFWDDDKVVFFDDSFDIVESFIVNIGSFKQINSVFVDSKKNTWVSTNKGIYYYNHKKHNYLYRSYNNETDNVLLLKNLEAKLYYANDMGQLSYIQEGRMLPILDSIHQPPDKIYDIKLYENELLVTKRNMKISFVNSFGAEIEKRIVSKFDKRTKTYGCKNIALSNDYLWCPSFDLISYNLEQDQFNLIRKGKHHDIATDITGSLALASCDTSIILFSFHRDSALAIDSVSIDGIKYIENIDNIDNDVFLCSDLVSSSYIYSQRIGLQEIDWLSKDEYIVQVVIDNHRLIYQTNKSILVSDSNQYAETSPSLLFNIKAFDPTLIINDIEYFEGLLYLGTSKGLRTVDIDRAINNDKVEQIDFYFTAINNTYYKSDSNYTFDYENRSVTIDYNIIDFTSNEHVYFEYTLKGPAIIESQTENRSLNFDRLPAGSYDLNITPYKFSNAVGKIHTLSFVIKKPYWQTTWFFALLILIGLLTVGTLLYLYVRRLNKKATISQKYAELELNALQSQMNPHFVFNAMNSIQNLINTDRVDDADKYLSKFARLMRQFLEVSRQKFIPLYEEIDIVEKYLELEILRFGSELTYTFQTSLTEDDMEMNVPATLIQPFVENAVIHGLFHKKRKGHINISLYKKKETIYIEIDDDGIGRKASQVIKQNRSIAHVSRGKELIDEKMIVLNQMKMYEIAYETIDKYENETAIGTLVTIRIKQSNES